MNATFDRSRLVAWSILISALVLLSYASRASGGKPPEDAAYKYTTAVGGVVQYGIILAIVNQALLQPGPRIGDGLMQVARLLHPDAFR